MYNPRCFNLAYMKREYHTVHMATQNRQHSEIACGTRHANICSDNVKEVSCLRCHKTDAFRYAQYNYLKSKTINH